MTGWTIYKFLYLGLLTIHGDITLYTDIVATLTVVWILDYNSDTLHLLFVVYVWLQDFLMVRSSNQHCKACLLVLM